MSWESIQNSCWLNFCNAWDSKREKDMSVANSIFFVLNHIKKWQFACWAQDKKTQDKADTSVAYIAICAFSQHLIKVVRYHLLWLSHMFGLLFSYNSDFLILLLLICFCLSGPSAYIVTIFACCLPWPPACLTYLFPQYFLPASQLTMLANLNVIVCSKTSTPLATLEKTWQRCALVRILCPPPGDTDGPMYPLTVVQWL